MLKYVLKYDGNLGTEFICLRIYTNGKKFSTYSWNFSF